MRFIYLFMMTFGLAVPAAADGFGFRTPSGNIYCNGSLDGGAQVGCVIVNREAGSEPAGFGTCPAGREYSVGISETGRVSGGCGKASGRISSYTDIADYGVSASFGRINCTSERTGFTCRNVDGHGFFLSRRSQQIF